MARFLRQHYGDCEGPLGVPCLDRQAKALDELLRSLPRDELHEPGHLVIAKATTELLPGERADVSWISTEDPDRMRDVVLARGMNDEHFRLNPVVTLQHAYWLPPVGRSLWRKRVRDGERMGVKAKTIYPARPASWPGDASWPPDLVFPLVQSGLLCGKSIGFLPTRVRTPTEDEVRRRPELAGVKRIVEEWVLLEYACVYLMEKPKIYGRNLYPNNTQNALVSLPGPVAGVLYTLLVEPVTVSCSRAAWEAWSCRGRGCVSRRSE